MLRYFFFNGVNPKKMGCWTFYAGMKKIEWAPKCPMYSRKSGNGRKKTWRRHPFLGSFFGQSSIAASVLAHQKRHKIPPLYTRLAIKGGPCHTPRSSGGQGHLSTRWVGDTSTVKLTPPSMARARAQPPERGNQIPDYKMSGWNHRCDMAWHTSDSSVACCETQVTVVWHAVKHKWQ